METCFNYTGETAYFSSDERKWHTKIRKLAAEHPDEVTILEQPETNDGCIYAKLPASWLKIVPPRQYSEEVLEKYRQGAKERLLNQGVRGEK